MKTKDVLKAMSKGSVLCMGYEGSERCYWLEPKRTIVPKEVAEAVIVVPGLKSGKESLFEDCVGQTWKIR